MSSLIALFGSGCELEMLEGGAADADTYTSAELDSSQQAIVRGMMNTGDLAVGYLQMSAEINGNMRPISNCTGTLVADRFLLTARHCVQVQDNDGLLPMGHIFRPEDITVVFATQPGPMDQPWGVNAHRIHETADVAILELTSAGPAEPVLMNRLPIEGQLGLAVRIAGYGITGSGRNDGGIKRMGMTSLLRVANIDPIGEVAITGPMRGEDGSKLCNGDSGGPTFMTIMGTEYLIGVNSVVGRTRTPGSMPRGDVRCEDTDNFNAQVRVDRYVDWVNAFIAERQGGGSTVVGFGACSAAPGELPATSSIALLAIALWSFRRRRRRSEPA